MMNSGKRWIVACVSLGLFWAAVAAQADPLSPIKPGPKDKCPVCGMFVAKYPDWVAEVRYKDEMTVFFDGAKDFFKYLFNVRTYDPDRSTDRIASMFVTDYYTLELIDARKAFFVVGSDVYGPMGRELIPFKTQADAEEFKKDHKGTQIVMLDKVTPALIKTLD